MGKIPHGGGFVYPTDRPIELAEVTFTRVPSCRNQHGEQLIGWREGIVSLLAEPPLVVDTDRELEAYIAAGCRPTATALDRRILDLKDKRGAVVCGSFADHHTTKANLIAAHALMLDIEGHGVTFDVALEKLQGYEFVLHTTFKHSESFPRLRAFLPFSHEVASHEAFERVWRGAQELLGLTSDPATKNANRLAFLPVVRAGAPYLYEARHGKPLDVLACLTAAAPRPQATKSFDPVALAQTHPPAVSGDGGSDVFWDLCLAYKRKGVSRESARQIIDAHYNPRCRPPWSAGEIEHKLSDCYESDRVPYGADVDLAEGTADQTDLGNASKLVKWFGADLRFVGERKRWLAYDGTRWIDDSAGAFRLAQATTRRMYREAQTWLEASIEATRGANAAADAAIAGIQNTADADSKLDHEAAHKAAQTAIERAADEENAAKRACAWAHKSQSVDRTAAMLRHAQAFDCVALAPHALDADPMLFNVANGTIDLRTGVLRPHSRDDLLTNISPVTYDANAVCPQWDDMLGRIFHGDTELVAYVQRFLGYSLTGRVDEECLLFFHGDGINGKSTVVEVAMAVLGSYAVKAPRGLLTESANDRHPADIARLRGARLVCANETSKKSSWDEAKTKELCSREPLSARGMGENFYDFQPTHKLIVSGNHKPRIAGEDAGIWRRIKLVPFTYTIPQNKRVLHFSARLLKAESSGILAWMVRGCLAWQGEGLREPASVRDATEEYSREEGGTLRDFLDTQCVFGNDAAGRPYKISRRDLRQKYEEFCRAVGDAHPVGARALAQALKRRGVSDGASIRTSWGVSDAWAGVCLAESVSGLPTACPECALRRCAHVVCVDDFIWDGRQGQARPLGS